MDRRSFLRGVLTASATVAVAGCTGPVTPFGRGDLAAEVPTAHLDMRPLPDGDLPDRVLYSVPAEETDRKAKLVERILDDGATVERTRPPLPTDRRISYGDGVYELDHTVVEETPATTYSVKVDILQSSPSASETVAFADLPAVDRKQFADHGLEDGDPVGIGTTFLYTDTERERSVLVPGSQYSAITWANGAEAEWVVDGSYESVLKTFAYSGERVMSASAYGRRLRERFAFAFEGLSAAEREIVETAIGEDRFVVPPDEEPPDAVRSLAERFRRQDPVQPLAAAAEDEGNGPYLVRHRDDIYWTTFSLREPTTPTA
ncbi:hypothetical protein [Haloarcula pelagica]|uniref:hypothetical protein n=1 Tax=Haloarcula pelagica TaxID=3033389 RepID=UPI0024C2FA05|nr:hypothetical protein [Halomicroarcula sp. YJ-61-S]